MEHKKADHAVSTLCRVLGVSTSGYYAVDAVNMAVWNCRPAPGVIHHSDHGEQYAAIAFGCTLKEAGILGSMGTVGEILDS
ncbi:MAG: hypothetical protein ACM3X3_01735, partial [Betaproteobacteria bacterium]